MHSVQLLNEQGAGSVLYRGRIVMQPYLQVVAVQCPAWASQLLQRPAHITISTAEGVKDNSAGDLLRRVEKGHIYGVQTSACTDGIM